MFGLTKSITIWSSIWSMQSNTT